MATYYVYSGAAGTNSGADWTNAYTAYGSAVTAANAAGDVIKVHKTHTEELGADTTYTFLANVATICVDKDSSDALATMGTAAWIGNSTTNRSVAIGGAFNLYFYGITFRISGSTSDHLTLAATDGMSAIYEECYLWQGNTSASFPSIRCGTADVQAFCKLINCTLRLNSTAGIVGVASRMVIEGGSLAATGTIPTNGLFSGSFTVDTAGPSLDVIGFDASYLGANAIVANSSNSAFTVRLSQCKLGASYTLLATQTNLNGSSAEVFAFDCASGDTHGLFAYANPLGSVSSDTGIYFTSGAAAQSWKVVTTSAANFYTPFVTPWIGYYNTGTSAITPYMEILRDGSATAYQDDEVWGEWAAKVTTGSTQATLYSDRMTLLGTPANQAAGAGLGSWTGETTTGAPDAWSGKVAPGSSFTPAENGHIQGRLCVGEPSITVYVDPQIRT